MGYQVGTTCYGSATDALSAAASSQVGGVVVHGGASYVVGVDSVASTSITYRLTPLMGGQPVQSVVQLSPQPCGLLEWQDGLSLGWGVAAAWIVTAAVMHLRRAANQ